MTNAILRGKPDAGNPHVRFDEGEVASAKPRRGSLLYKGILVVVGLAFACTGWCGGRYAYLRSFEVDGRPVSLAENEMELDLAKLLPEKYASGGSGADWATVESVVESAGDMVNGMRTAILSLGSAEGFKALYPPLQGETSIFSELPRSPSPRGDRKFQGASDWEARLPRPIFDERPELVEFYVKAWEIAHTRIDNLPGIPVPRYMDEGHRSDWIWIWDTCFMAHFCKYAPWEFPGIESLGNFYGIMFPEGEFKPPKVIGNRWSCGPSGIDDPWEGKLLDFKLALPDNPPLFAWTEYRHALQTGDRSRLERVYREKRCLQRWFEMFENFTPEDAPRTGVLATPHLRREGDLGYHWDGGRSGMDNTPRGRKGEKDLGPKSPADCPDNPDLLWVDAYSQQALAALYISRIADLLGDAEGVASWRAKYEAKKAKINELYWDEADGFYYDILVSDLSKCKVPTMASYWPLLAEIPDAARRARLVEKLRDPVWFGGDIPMPSLARKDADFWPTGGYWRGGVWMPTTYMTIKGLDRFGEFALARDLAKKIVFDMYETYRQVEPHTVWECYSPTEPKPATYAKSKGWVRDNFCGWSALGPISLFIEDMIGIKEANAFLNELTCNFADAIKGRVGVENYRFGKVTCSIVATTEKIEVESDAAFLLRANGRDYAVRPGKNVFDRRAKETIVIMPCHPDDLISALGLCLKAHDRFDIHVVDFTHGERGLGPKGLADGSTKKIRDLRRVSSKRYSETIQSWRFCDG